MTLEAAIYLYGFACGVVALAVAQFIIRAVARWSSRDEREFTGGEV